ncbi:DinB family protein [Pseudoruegeria sp. HB172150]|uniref:DinB family protein n=1 Tax=Pseudoruegeria sp. HB172150 TaxID=2721164 RepID=UPI001556D060|nr:DinB family protein [Pseudoruegeria sp. HB172150]
MITKEFCRTMARYNNWQNTNLIGAADKLDDMARVRDRGAFFGSIQGTLNHILWGDTIWMSRLAGWDKPDVGIVESPRFMPDWETYKEVRSKADARILAWALALQDKSLTGNLSWFSGALNSDVERPTWICVQHFFNHQTHHRGQVHALLTASGVKPGETDLFVMPVTV